jgi:hypothetical protein
MVGFHYTTHRLCVEFSSLQGHTCPASQNSKNFCVKQLLTSCPAWPGQNLGRHSVLSGTGQGQAVAVACHDPKGTQECPAAPSHSKDPNPSQRPSCRTCQSQGLHPWQKLQEVRSGGPITVKLMTMTASDTHSSSCPHYSSNSQTTREGRNDLISILHTGKLRHEAMVHTARDMQVSDSQRRSPGHQSPFLESPRSTAICREEMTS